MLSASATTIDEALDLALRYHETVQIAVEQETAADEQIREAVSEALPNVELSSLYDRNWSLPSFIFDTPAGREKVDVGAHNNLTTSLRLTQAVYSGGKVRAARAAARLAREGARTHIRAAEQDVLASVEVAFYDALLAGQLLDVSRVSMDLARANLKRAESLHRAGRVSEYDQLRARVELAQQRPDSIRAANQVVLATASLEDAIGLPQHGQISAVGEYRLASALDRLSLSQLQDLAETDRPSIQQLDLQLRMEREGIKVIRAGGRPTLDLVANAQMQVQTNQFSYDGDDAQRSYTTGFVLRVPVFDGLRTRAQVQRARAETRARELEAQQLRRQVRAEVRQLLLGLTEARERLAAQAGTVAQTQRGLQIADSRYASGVGTQLEVLDAQLSLTRARTEEARGRRDVAVALVQLEHAVGRISRVSGGVEK